MQIIKGFKINLYECLRPSENLLIFQRVKFLTNNLLLLKRIVNNKLQLRKCVLKPSLCYIDSALTAEPEKKRTYVQKLTN